MINVLGDALAAGIMAHVCRKDFTQDTGTEVRTVPPSQPGCPKTRGWSQVGWARQHIGHPPAGQPSPDSSMPCSHRGHPGDRFL